MLLDFRHNIKIHVIRNCDGFIRSVVVEAYFLANCNDFVCLLKCVFLRNKPGAAQVIVRIFRRRPLGDVPFGGILGICFIIRVAALDIKAYGFAEILIARADRRFARYAPIVNDLSGFIHRKVGSINGCSAALLNNVNRLDQGFRVYSGIVIRPAVRIAQELNIVAGFAVCKHNAVAVQNAPAFPL